MNLSEDIDRELSIELSFDGTQYHSTDYFDVFKNASNKKILFQLVEEALTEEAKNQKHAGWNTERFFLRICNYQNKNPDLIREEQNTMFSNLSTKEKVVLYFLGTGSKREHTAAVLRITINTLRQHQKNVYRKMGFNNKVQMAVWCSKYFKF